MYPRLYFTKFISISVVLHALFIAALLYLAAQDAPPAPFTIPVNIVNLPQQAMKNLPPARPPSQVIPDKHIPLSEVPTPKKFGTSDEVRLPRVLPRPGKPSGAEQGKKAGKAETKARRDNGPLPFLSQSDIDNLARKGMPAKKPGDNSVTLDTDEFKFISYNRWLKIKVESVLKYPELAAVSGYQGTLYIKFDIMKDGSLGGVELLKSSGYKILDDEALRAIRNSAPFQALPGEWNMDRYSIRAAVIFYMNEGYIR